MAELGSVCAFVFLSEYVYTYFCAKNNLYVYTCGGCCRFIDCRCLQENPITKFKKKTLKNTISFFFLFVLCKLVYRTQDGIKRTR